MEPMTLTQVGLLLVEASKKVQKEKRASLQELLHVLRPVYRRSGSASEYTSSTPTSNSTQVYWVF